jgi:hypothetical protein
MAKQPFDPNKKPSARSVRVADCHARFCTDLQGREKVAVLTFSSNRELLGPFCLSIPQVHVLVRELIRVLQGFGEGDHQSRSGDIITRDGTVPNLPVPIPPLRNGIKRTILVKPSRNALSPHDPINETEPWQLHLLLKNVKSHEDFLRFIGADRIEDEPEQAEAPKASKRAAHKPPAIRSQKTKGKR